MVARVPTGDNELLASKSDLNVQVSLALWDAKVLG